MTVISIYYDPYENMFYNDEGDTVYDIFRYVAPCLLDTLKKRQGHFYFDDPKNKNVKYEIVFPITDEDDWRGELYEEPDFV